MDAPRVLLVDGVWRDREALTRHAGRAAETLVVRSPEAESPAARSRLGAESALSRPSKPDTRGMTSQQALRISVEKALSGTSSPRSIAAVRSAKWHLSTPRVGAGAFLNPKFFSHGAGRSPRSPESSSAQRTGVPKSTALLPTSTSAPAPEPAPAQHQSPRDYIRNLERMRNADSVATLVRGVDLSKEMVRQIETGALDPSLIRTLVNPLGQPAPSPLTGPGRSHPMLKSLNFELSRDKPCVAAVPGPVSDWGRKEPPAKTWEVNGDKPLVSLPGESTTAWRRDPDPYMEYSDQFAVTQRPARGERLKTAPDRDALPYCRAKKEKKEDGAYAKPLVGYRNYQGYCKPTIASSKSTGGTTSVLENREVRSSFREFRDGSLQPVTLNRTFGYEGAEAKNGPQTPYGIKATEITNYALEKWQDPNPGMPDNSPTSAEQKEREKHLMIRRALRGPPNLGKSLIPRHAVADDFTIKIKDRPQIPVVKLDARPAVVRQGKDLRALLKLARKKVHHHVTNAATPQYLKLDAPSSASSNHMMTKMWDEYINWTRHAGVERDDGRLSKKDFGDLVRKLGMNKLTDKNVDSIFQFADTDFSGTVDWAEFSNLLVANASRH